MRFKENLVSTLGASLAFFKSWEQNKMTCMKNFLTFFYINFISLFYSRLWHDRKSFIWLTLGFTCVAFVTGALAFWAPKFLLYASHTQGIHESERMWAQMSNIE